MTNYSTVKDFADSIGIDVSKVIGLMNDPDDYIGKTINILRAQRGWTEDRLVVQRTNMYLLVSRLNFARTTATQFSGLDPVLCQRHGQN